jgi:uroporphyrinogen-III synthase
MAYAVLTRDPEACAAYAEALGRLGLEVVAMPVTRTAPPPDEGALARALEAGGYAVILVASARAAQALDRARGHVPLAEVWAVGPATAAALHAAGIPARQPEAAHDASTLAAALLGARELVGKKVLVPRAAEGRDEAITMLRAAGALVDDIAAYRTVPVAADDVELAMPLSLLVTGQAAVCALFAPSQVTALHALLGSLAELPTQFVAIGETTADALHAAGVSEVGVADRPTPEGLANAVAAVYPPTS